MTERSPPDHFPRTHIPWVRSDHHECPDKRSRKKSLRIRADGYGKCFRCGWRGWTDGPRATEEEIRRAKRIARHAHMTVNEIVQETLPVLDGPVFRYLERRRLVPEWAGLSCMGSPWPRDLRSHDALLHTPSKKRFPAMVAILRTPDGEVTGIHRTYLTEDGEKITLDPPRMVLGRVRGSGFHAPPHPTKGDGFYLFDYPTAVCIVEGIEDALAARLMYPGLGAWATISSANMRESEPPPDYFFAKIIADNDAPGRKAAKALYGFLGTDFRPNGRAPWKRSVETAGDHQDPAAAWFAMSEQEEEQRG